MKGKLAVISGGMGDVGKAVATQLAKDGFTVAVLYFSTPPDDAAAFIQTLQPGTHVALRCDLRNRAEVERVFASLRETHGNVYACIHAAVDPIIRKDVSQINEAELQGQLSAALLGGFNFFQCGVGIMKKEEEGRIIGILTQYQRANITHKKMAGYMIAKYALRGLLRELYAELSASKIAVQAIAPDYLDTKLSGDLPKVVREFVKERGATGSMRSLEDVTRAISFLCSQEGSAINGKIFSFDETEMIAL